MTRAIDIKELVAMLAARALELARTVLPNGHHAPPYWRCGSLAGEPGQSLCVYLRQGKAGEYYDFSSGEAGDALDLVTHARCGGRKSDAVAWAKAWLGLDGADPKALKRTQRALASASQAKPDDPARYRDAALRLWLEAQPAIAGTPAARYLLGRGIDLAQLGRQPRALRFHPSCWNRESDQRWPALLAQISGPNGMVAVHRTYLQARADGSVAKAPLREAKMTLGSFRGGCIRVWRGAEGCPLAAVPPGGAVTLTEGLEDALSIAIAAPERRVLCAVSLANLAGVVLPPAIATVTIAADNDTKPAAIAALDRAIAAHTRAGRRVLVARSPVGKDFNDLARGAA